MISDTDILAGIREAGHDAPAWATAELDAVCPPTADIAPNLCGHFGVTFREGELEAIGTVKELVVLLRKKFDEE